jgi:glycogen debranching enzyme
VKKDADLPGVIGAGRHGAYYDIDDRQVSAGSTLGGPKCVCIVKSTGAIEKVYSSDYGKTLIGSIVPQHWDEDTGIPLTALPGRFRLHPSHQEHFYQLSNGAEVRENIFVLSGEPKGAKVDPPAVYFTVELSNPTDRTLHIATYFFAQLRGEMGHDVASAFDKRRNAIVAWNESDPSFARLITCSEPVTSWETTMNHGKAIASISPGLLTNRAVSPATDPLGVLHMNHTLRSGARVSFSCTVTFSLDGAKAALALVHTLPSAADALRATQSYYHDILNRSVVLTPDAQVNAGVIWAKANMLRTMLLAPTGWSFVNDPTRSNNSVGRDTAWFAFGADYILPEFAEASLLWYAEHLERKGMVVEYYDVRTGKTADYKLNINDNTPLLILALWHHYNTTNERAFLKRIYPAALKAANYILSQRNEQGLVWCTADGVSDWGICGWRNVIAGYRLSGATTEVNSECYAALLTISHMARELGRHKESATFKNHAEALRSAINEHLLDPSTGLYYLNIDLDGTARSDVTADLIFPVMFGVADETTSATIVARLSAEEFWTEAGIRTVPRNATNYGPTHGYGLLGGVWVGVAFWYAFAAARFNSENMASALARGFEHYAKDPGKNNTVPGQFSEWLHGETLANQGMMLSPWFPPRYLWAAIEGAAGLDLSAGTPTINPRLPPQWKWVGVRNVILAEKRLTWFVVRVPDVRLYTNATFRCPGTSSVFEEDISSAMSVEGEDVVTLGLRQGESLALFVANTSVHTLTTALRVVGLFGSFAGRQFNSLRGEWTEIAALSASDLQRGMPVELDRQGFCLLELTQDV